MRFHDKFQAHLETWRPYTSIYPGFLALAAAVFWHHGLPGSLETGLIFAAPTLGWLAGLYGCDYFDRELDRIEKAHRPLPSGRMGEREAFICMMALMYLGFLASSQLGLLPLLLAGCVMASSVAYTLVKTHAILGNSSRGMAGALTLLFGIVSANKGVWPLDSTPLLLLLSLLFLLHDMTTNLVGTIRDVKGDSAGNCQTIPVRYGVKAAANLAVLLAL